MSLFVLIFSETKIGSENTSYAKSFNSTKLDLSCSYDSINFVLGKANNTRGRSLYTDSMYFIRLYPFFFGSMLITTISHARKWNFVLDAMHSSFAGDEYVLEIACNVLTSSQS